MNPGIRVKFCLVNITDKITGAYLEFGIDYYFPIIPLIGDKIEICKLINKKDFSEEDFDKIGELMWTVDSRVISKDEKDIYITIWCSGE